MMKDSLGVTVRRATLHDAATLSVFARDVFHASFAADNRPEDMAVYLAQAFSPDIQRAELEDARRVCLLVEEDGVLVAYATVYDGASHEAVAAAHPVELHRFYLAHHWHGRGLAASLMAEVQDVARAMGGDVLWLGVWERNPRAIRFYERQGFTRVGAHTFWLGSDEQHDAVMALPLAR